MSLHDEFGSPVGYLRKLYRDLLTYGSSFNQSKTEAKAEFQNLRQLHNTARLCYLQNKDNFLCCFYYYCIYNQIHDFHPNVIPQILGHEIENLRNHINELAEKYLFYQKEINDLEQEDYQLFEERLGGNIYLCDFKYYLQQQLLIQKIEWYLKKPQVKAQLDAHISAIPLQDLILGYANEENKEQEIKFMKENALYISYIKKTPLTQDIKPLSEIGFELPITLGGRRFNRNINALIAGRNAFLINPENIKKLSQDAPEIFRLAKAGNMRAWKFMLINFKVLFYLNVFKKIPELQNEEEGHVYLLKLSPHVQDVIYFLNKLHIGMRLFSCYQSQLSDLIHKIKEMRDFEFEAFYDKIKQDSNLKSKLSHYLKPYIQAQFERGSLVSKDGAPETLAPETRLGKLIDLHRSDRPAQTSTKTRDNITSIALKYRIFSRENKKRRTDATPIVVPDQKRGG